MLRRSSVSIIAAGLLIVLTTLGCPGAATGGGGSTPAMPPAAISVNPTANSTSVPTGTTIGVAFNQAMDKASVTAAFQVSRGGSAVPGSVNCTGDNATFSPTARLQANTMYSVQIQGAYSASGVPLPSYSWSFTTGS